MNCSIALLQILNFAKRATVSIRCNPLLGDFAFPSCFRFLCHNKDLNRMSVISRICVMAATSCPFLVCSVTTVQKLAARIFTHVKTE